MNKTQSQPYTETEVSYRVHLPSVDNTATVTTLLMNPTKPTIMIPLPLPGEDTSLLPRRPFPRSASQYYSYRIILYMLYILFTHSTRAERAFLLRSCVGVTSRVSPTYVGPTLELHPFARSDNTRTVCIDVKSAYADAWSITRRERLS